jgi:uncharacterized membrane protein
MQLHTFIEILGWLGASLILGAYALISSAKLAANSALYQWMNVVGATGFMVNGGYHGAWPSFGLNVIWLAIAIIALRRNARARRT